MNNEEEIMTMSVTEGNAKEIVRGDSAFSTIINATISEGAIDASNYISISEVTLNSFKITRDGGAQVVAIAINYEDDDSIQVMYTLTSTTGSSIITSDKPIKNIAACVYGGQQRGPFKIVWTKKLVSADNLVTYTEEIKKLITSSNPDLSDYVTNESLNSSLESYATKADLDNYVAEDDISYCTADDIVAIVGGTYGE